MKMYCMKETSLKVTVKLKFSIEQCYGWLIYRNIKEANNKCFNNKPIYY